MSFCYVEGLCRTDQTRYRKKLSTLLANTSPYKLSAGSWVDDPMTWPGIEWSDVSYYLVDILGVFTRESMRDRRSLEQEHICRWSQPNQQVPLCLHKGLRWQHHRLQRDHANLQEDKHSSHYSNSNPTSLVNNILAHGEPQWVNSEPLYGAFERHR